MIHLFSKKRILKEKLEPVLVDEQKKIMIFRRGDYLFVFSFNPQYSFENYEFEIEEGKWMPVLDSDSKCFGGFDRNENIPHFSTKKGEKSMISLYIPCRTAIVLHKE